MSGGAAHYTSDAPALTVGVLALQGAFAEHIALLHTAAAAAAAATAAAQTHGNTHSTQQQHEASTTGPPSCGTIEALPRFDFIEVRTPGALQRCCALIIPGGESTSISLIAQRTGLLEPLREFVKVQRRPVWGTCAGLILLAESANRTKDTGQDLIGGLDVRVQRNYFGRQVESFEADLDLPFLGHAAQRFHSVFIRAPVVEKVLDGSSGSVVADDEVVAPARRPTTAPVQILGRLPGRAIALRDKTTTADDLGEDGDIVAVRQGNVFGTAFHPELTGDARIHAWWLQEVVKAVSDSGRFPT